MSEETNTTCKYCFHTFSTHANLKKHLKIPSKFCKEQRKNADTDNSEQILTFTCNKCEKVLCSKNSLEQHQLICKNNSVELKEKDNIIDNLHQTIDKMNKNNDTLLQTVDELKNKNSDLERKIIELDSSLKTMERLYINFRSTPSIAENLSVNASTVLTSVTDFINYINISELKPLTIEMIKNAEKSLDNDIASKGVDGYVSWAYGKILHNVVACTDDSRTEIVWKDNNNKLITEEDGTTLINFVFGTISTTINDQINGINYKIECCIKGPNDFIRQQNIKEMLLKVKEVCNTKGVSTDFSINFMKQLKKKLKVCTPS